MGGGDYGDSLGGKEAIPCELNGVATGVWLA